MHEKNLSVFGEIQAGLIVGFLAILLAISYASVVFNGILQPYLPHGIASLYYSTVVLILIICIWGSSKVIISAPSHSFIVISSITVANIGFALQKVPGINPMPTIMMALTSLSMATGVWLYLLGKFNLGAIVRFIPYPVICGFMAAIGWLLFKAGFDSIVGQSLSLNTLIHPENSLFLTLAAVSFVYALMMQLTLGEKSNPFMLLLFLITALVGFYIFLWIKGISLENALQQHLMIGTYKTDKYLPELFYPSAWTQIQWPLLLDNAKQYFSLLAITPLAFMLKMSSFEIQSKQDININKDLKTVGTASVLAGIVGGFEGYIDPVLTGLNLDLGVKTRLPALIVAGLFILILFSPIPILNYIPRFISAVVIFYLTLNFFSHWLIKTWKFLSWSEYLIVLIILFSIANLDLFAGVFIGLVITMVDFLIRYSHLSAIKKMYTGPEIKSRVVRSTDEALLLKKYNQNQFIMILNGFLFFGNIYSIVENIKLRLENTAQPLRFLVIDLKSVTGIDSSAVLGLSKITQLTQKSPFIFLLTGLSESLKNKIENYLTAAELSQINLNYPDLDHALEWIEEQNLSDNKATPSQGPVSNLGELIYEVQKQIPDLTTMQIDTNQIIYDINEPADSFYYLKSGEADILLPTENNQETRLRSIHADTLVGEMGVFLKHKRTARVRSLKPCTVVRISTKALQELEQVNPQLALALYKEIIIMTCDRLSASNQMLVNNE